MSYLAEMRAHKAKRTLAAYQSTLRLFAVSIKQEHVKDIAPDASECYNCGFPDSTTYDARNHLP